jgi:DNA-binding GntR family transcriptional regulator
MKQNPSHSGRTVPSRLQREIAAGILDMIRKGDVAPETRLREVELAERLHVSRTPVRAALRLLARRGLVRQGERRGYFVREPNKAASKSALRNAPADTDLLFIAITRDRRTGRLAEEVSERDLMRRYKATRSTVQRVLAKLAEVAAVQRKPGHGWRFQPTLVDAQAREESYRLRMIIEPAALLEPGFRLSAEWIEDMRRRHVEMLAKPWSATSSIALYEMNAAFHEGLAAASGNRYLLAIMQQQNRLRRFANYDWTFGQERVAVSCREHLAILERLEAGDRQGAARLLLEHLDSTSKLRREPARARAAECQG